GKSVHKKTPAKAGVFSILLSEQIPQLELL
ncbi:MAG: hypothetical protein RI911_485, partial [Candidatus Parcubacteria bacterium]